MPDTELFCERLNALMDKGVISRRKFLSAVGALGVGAATAGALAACGEGTPTTTTLVPSGVKLEGKGEAIIGSWGGTFEEGQRKGIEPVFKKLYGGTISFVAFEYGKLKAGVEGGVVEWDIGSMNDISQARAESENLIQKIDYSLVPAAQELEEGARQEYGVGFDYEATVMGYNRERYGDDHPKTWADFFDVEKYPGARSLYAAAGDEDQILAPALLADGVPLDQLDEALQQSDAMDRAFKKLEQLKATGAIKKFWTTGAECQTLIKNKEVDLITAWNGRLTQVIAGGATHVGIEWNQGLYYYSTYCVPKGNPNGKNAFHLLNAASMAEAQVAFAELTHYGPTNPKAMDLISENLRQYMSSYPDNLKKMAHLNAAYWVDMIPKVDARWQAFMAS